MKTTLQPLGKMFDPLATSTSSSALEKKQKNKTVNSWLDKMSWLMPPLNEPGRGDKGQEPPLDKEMLSAGFSVGGEFCFLFKKNATTINQLGIVWIGRLRNDFKTAFFTIIHKLHTTRIDSAQERKLEAVFRKKK